LGGRKRNSGGEILYSLIVPMSVEQQGEEASSVSASQLPNACVDQDESLNTDTTSLSSTTLQLDVDVTTERNGYAEPEQAMTIGETKRGIYGWFDGLSADERAGALGFIDGAFLATFLAVIPPSSASEPYAAADATVVHSEGEYLFPTVCCTPMPTCVCWILFERQFNVVKEHVEF
jgi:hypothetical protein